MNLFLSFNFGHNGAGADFFFSRFLLHPKICYFIGTIDYLCKLLTAVKIQNIVQKLLKITNTKLC